MQMLEHFEAQIPNNNVVKKIKLRLNAALNSIAGRLSASHCATSASFRERPSNAMPVFMGSNHAYSSSHACFAFDVRVPNWKCLWFPVASDFFSPSFLRVFQVNLKHRMYCRNIIQQYADNSTVLRGKKMKV